MKKRRRIVLLGGLVLLAVLALAAALTVWLGRDWPRRQVESALAEAFAAEVGLGRLELRDRRTAVLHGLAIRQSRYYPWLESLEAERVTVSGTLGEFLEKRIRSVRVDGARAVLRETDRRAEESETPSAALVERLELPGGTLVVRGGGGETALSLEGEVTGLGSALGGEVRLTGEALHLAPLLSFILGSDGAAGLEDDLALDLRAPVSGAEASLRFGAGGAFLRLTAGAGGGIPYREAGRPDLPFPGIDLRLDEAPGGGWLVAGTAELPGVAAVTVAGKMGADGGASRLTRLDLESGDPALLLFTLGLAPGDVRADGSLSLALENSGGDRSACRIAARAESLFLPGLDLAPFCPLVLDYVGSLHPDGGTGGWRTAGEARLVSGAAGRVAAEGELIFGGPANSVEADWRWSGTGVRALLQLASRFGAAIPEAYSIDGTARAAGHVGGPLDDPLVGGTATFDRLAFCLRPEGNRGCLLEAADGRANVEFGWRMSGDARITGKVTAGRLAACLETAGDPGCSVGLAGGAMDARFDWREGRDLRFPSLSLRGDLTMGRLEPLPLSCSASARLGRGSAAGTFEDLDATIGDVARFTGGGGWDHGAGDPFTALLRLERANLPAIRRALLPLTGELLPGYGLEAPLTGALDVALDGDGRWTLGGTIDAGEAWFASEDGANAVQGLAAAWRVSLEAGPGGDVRAEAAAETGGFQLLWGPVFGDYGDLRPGVRLSAGLDGGDGRWWAEARLRPADGVELDTALSGGGGERLRYRGSLRLADLAAAFETCARQPLGGSFPVLERIEAAGGIEAEARGEHRGEGTTLQGRVRLAGMNFTGAEGTMAVRGLALDLPLDLSWGPPEEDGSRPVTGPPLEGRVGFEEVRLDRLAFGATDSGLAVRGDTVSLVEAQTIPLLGGAVTMHRLTLAGLLGKGRRLEAGLTIDGLQLAELSRALEWPLFEGAVSGHLPRVTLSPTRLRVEGGGEVALFGGVVRISGISGEDVLSRYPRLTFSAEWSGIDLAEATRTFDVGEVTGILEGRVDDCRLFAGTPVAFRAGLRTVPRKGVPQTINVKAINNLAIVGTGGRITVFDRGIHSLLDRYTYEQLGVQMRLDRDQFYLRGTEQRGGRELFLKGSLPFRIDVVNAQPGKTVSFSTMLARLQAIDFSTAVTESGPAAQPAP